MPDSILQNVYQVSLLLAGSIGVMQAFNMQDTASLDAYMMITKL